MGRTTTPRATGKRPLRKDLRAILLDGMGCSFMVGAGESYVPAFALAVGLSEIASGLVVSLPLLVGAVIQMVSPWAVARMRSYRLWVSGTALLQALSFLPLAWAAFRGAVGAVTLFALVSLYWASGLAAGPAWSTWVGWLVRRPLRARYFGFRNRWCQAALLAGLLAGGFALHAAKGAGALLPAFGALFLAAASARLFSAFVLYRQSETERMRETPLPVPLPRLLRKLREDADGRLLLYLVLVQATTTVVSPYLNPYMLERLRLPYAAYMALLAAAFLGRVALLPALGRLAHRFGAAALLRAAGIAIVPLPTTWLVTDAFLPLFAFQFLGGVAWGAYELASFLLYFDSMRENERTTMLTTFQLAHAVATLLGSAIGAAWLAAGLGYAWLFVVATAARTLTIPPLLRLHEAARPRAAAVLLAADRDFDPRLPDRAAERVP